MTKRTRTILFLSLLLCFLLIAPSIIFYSWGYRFDFQAKTVVKTGAFYFKVLPKSSQISIFPLDNKGQMITEKELTKKTDFFFGAALVENLLPKSYEINIAKDDFFPWKKILEIKANQVTEAKNIVLIPTDIGKEILAKNVANFFFSPDEKTVVFQEFNETAGSTSTAFSLKILDLEKNVKSQLIASQDISKNSDWSLLDLKFSPDSKTIIIKTASKEQLKYYLLDSDQTPIKARALDFFGRADDFSFNPKDNQKLWLFENGEIFEANLAQNKIFEPRLKNIKSYKILNDTFYYLDSSGFLFKTGLAFSQPAKINNQPLALTSETNYRIYIFSDWIFLSDNENLYWLNPDSDSFEKFSETKNEPVVSPNAKKMVYYSDHEIWVLFLEDELGQPPKKKGEKLFIGRFSEKVDQVFWLNSHYLIFNNQDKQKIAEIDDRDLLNVTEVAEITSPEIFWNSTDKKLFFKSNDDFYSSRQLLP